MSEIELHSSVVTLLSGEVSSPQQTAFSFHSDRQMITKMHVQLVLSQVEFWLSEEVPKSQLNKHSWEEWSLL